ncbi:MAG: TetR/AcrR family transcriptional regulator [Thermodesulfobacteriota bacterium]
MTKTRRNPEVTRTTILDAAEEIFLAQGYSATPISQIARRAGVAKSLIHHHFTSKSNLWMEVKKRRFVPIARQQLELQENTRPSLAMMNAAIRLQFEFLEKNPQIIRIISWMFLEQDNSEVVELDRKLIQTTVETLRKSQRMNILRGDIDARFILMAVDALLMHWFQHKEYFMGVLGTDGLTGNLNEAYIGAVQKIIYEGVLAKQTP